MGSILTIGVVLGILALFLFSYLVFPIWTIVHCSSSSRSGTSKGVWIVCMILIWPIASFVYGVFASEKKFFQWFSSFSLIGIVLLVGVLFWGAGTIEDQAKIDVGNHIIKFEQIETSQLQQDQRNKLKESLAVLQEELDGGITKYTQKETAINLINYYDYYAQDDAITLEEYDDWVNNFDRRALMDRQAFKNKVDEVRAGGYPMVGPKDDVLDMK